MNVDGQTRPVSAYGWDGTFYWRGFSGMGIS